MAEKTVEPINIAPDPKAKRSGKPKKTKVVDHRVSVLGRSAHKLANGTVLKKGQHYSAKALGTKLEDLHAEPKLAVEPINEDGEVVVAMENPSAFASTADGVVAVTKED